MWLFEVIGGIRDGFHSPSCLPKTNMEPHVAPFWRDSSLYTALFEVLWGKASPKP